MDMELTSKQWEALSEIVRDIGQVFFAAVLVEPLLNGTFNIKTISLGLTLSLVLWITSLLIIR